MKNTKMEQEHEHNEAQLESIGEESLADLQPEEAAFEEAEVIIGEDPRDDLIAILTEERDQFKDQFLRTRADFDNYRKRVARDAERTARAAAEALFRDVLPVVDNLELALQHANDPTASLAQGVEMVLKQLCDVLSKNDVTPIPALGCSFNPHLHEAVVHLECEEVPENIVAQEFQRGYTVGALVLRPSKVAVSRGRAADDEEEPAASSSGNKDNSP